MYYYFLSSFFLYPFTKYIYPVLLKIINLFWLLNFYKEFLLEQLVKSIEMFEVLMKTFK